MKYKDSLKSHHKNKKQFFLNMLFIPAVCAVCLLAAAALYFSENDYSEEKKAFDGSVLQYEDVVDTYAARYDIEEYKDYILAIIQVESKGKGSDIMQSSESAGLELNTYSPEESIERGCQYFRELLDYNEYFGCDNDTILQAYNYGNGFIKYAAENGKEYSFDLAAAYAREKSDDTRVFYINEAALRHNMIWRYGYGNMFYVELIHQYV